MSATLAHQHFQQMEIAALPAIPVHFELKYSLPNPQIIGQNIVQFYDPEKNESSIYVVSNGKIKHDYKLPFEQESIKNMIIAEDMVAFLVDSKIYFLKYLDEIPSIRDVEQLEEIDLAGNITGNDSLLDMKMFQNRESIALGFKSFMIVADVHRRKVEKIWYGSVDSAEAVAIGENCVNVICAKTKKLYWLQYILSSKKFRCSFRSMKPVLEPICTSKSKLKFKNLTGMMMVHKACWLKFDDDTFCCYRQNTLKPAIVLKSENSSVYFFDQDTKQSNPVFISNSDGKLAILDVNGNILHDFDAESEQINPGHAITNDILLKNAGTWKILYLPDVLTQFLNLLDANQFEQAEKLLEDNIPDDFEDDKYSYETCLESLYQKWLEHSLEHFSDDQDLINNSKMIVEKLTKISSKLDYFGQLDGIHVPSKSQVVLQAWYMCCRERCLREAEEAKNRKDYDERESYLNAYKIMNQKIDVLKTFLMIYNDYSVEEFEEFQNESIMSIFMNYTAEGDFEALKTLWNRHRRDLLELLDHKNIGGILSAFQKVSQKAKECVKETHDKIEQFIFDPEYGLLEGILVEPDGAISAISSWILSYIVKNKIHIDPAISIVGKFNKLIRNLAKRDHISKKTENSIQNELLSTSVRHLNSIQIKLERYREMMTKLKIDFSKEELAKLLTSMDDFEQSESKEKQIISEKLLKNTPVNQIKSTVEEKMSLYVAEYYPSCNIDELLIDFVMAQTEDTIRQNILVETVKQVQSVTLKLNCVFKLAERYDTDKWSDQLETLIKKFVDGQYSCNFSPDNKELKALTTAVKAKASKDMLSKHGLSVEDITDRESLHVLVESGKKLSEDITAIMEQRVEVLQNQAFLVQCSMDFAAADEHISKTVSEISSENIMKFMGKDWTNLKLANIIDVVHSFDDIGEYNCLIPDEDRRLNNGKLENGDSDLENSEQDSDEENMTENIHRLQHQNSSHYLTNFQYLQFHNFTPVAVFQNPSVRKKYLTHIIYCLLSDAGDTMCNNVFMNILEFSDINEFLEAITSAINFLDNEDDECMTNQTVQIHLFAKCVKLLVFVFEKMNEKLLATINYQKFYACLTGILRNILFESCEAESIVSIYRQIKNELLPLAASHIPIQRSFGIYFVDKMISLLCDYQVYDKITEVMMQMPNKNQYQIKSENDVKQVKDLIYELLTKHEVLQNLSEFFNDAGNNLNDLTKLMFKKMQENYDESSAKIGTFQLVCFTLIHYSSLTISTFKHKEFKQFLEVNIPDSALKKLWDQVFLIFRPDSMIKLHLALGHTKSQDLLIGLVNEKAQQNKHDAKLSSKIYHLRNLDLVEIVSGFYNNAEPGLISGQLDIILKHLKNDAEWILKCLCENFICNEQMEEASTLKMIYHFESENNNSSNSTVDSVINLLRGFVKRDTSELTPEEREQLFQKYLADYLISFLSRQSLPLDISGLRSIFNCMSQVQLAQIKSHLDETLRNLTSPYDYEQIEKLILAIKEFDSETIEKEAAIFFKLKNYSRFAVPGKKERDAYNNWQRTYQLKKSQFSPTSSPMNGLQLSLIHSNRELSTEQNIEFPSDANERLPFHILRKSCCKEDILCKEVNERNQSKLVEIFNLIGVDDNKLHMSVLTNIMKRLEFTEDSITTKLEAKQRIIPHLLSIRDPEVYTGVEQLLLEQFKPNNAKVAILQAMIIRSSSDMDYYKDTYEEIKQKLDKTDPKFLNARKELEEKYKPLKHKQDSLKRDRISTLVELALVDAKLKKRDLNTNYSDKRGLIKEIFMKFGVSNSTINFEEIYQLIKKLCSIYKYPIPKMVADFVTSSCDYLAQIEDGQQSATQCSAGEIKNTITQLLSKFKNEDCDNMFGKNADEFNSKLASEKAEVYAFECFISAGKTDYVKKITGIDKKGILKTLTTHTYTDKIKKLGLQIKRSHLTTDKAVVEFIGAWDHWHDNLESLEVVAGLIVDYSIEGSFLVEKCLNALDTLLPKSHATLGQFLLYVESQRYTLPCVSQIKENLKRYNEGVFSQSGNSRSMYANTRSPRANPNPRKKIKALTDK